MLQLLNMKTFWISFPELRIYYICFSIFTMSWSIFYGMFSIILEVYNTAFISVYIMLFKSVSSLFSLFIYNKKLKKEKKKSKKEMKIICISSLTQSTDFFDTFYLLGLFYGEFDYGIIVPLSQIIHTTFKTITPSIKMRTCQLLYARSLEMYIHGLTLIYKSLSVYTKIHLVLHFNLEYVFKYLFEMIGYIQILYGSIVLNQLLYNLFVYIYVFLQIFVNYDEITR